MSTHSFLNSLPLFSPLPRDIKKQLNSIIITKNVTKGEVLFHETESAEAIFFINEGKVKLSKSSHDGKEILLNIRQAGEIFAEVALFCPKGSTYPATATVIESGTFSFIRNSDLEIFLIQHPELGIAIFRIMAERLQVAQTTLRDVALYGKLGALAATLVRLSEDYGEHGPDGIIIKLKLTHEELGSFFGATRESVTRMMNQLKHQGTVTKNSGFFIIHDIKHLRSYLNS
ncbi:CRP/FNR family transcriptional regulator, anaerobic regulatory protein [Evansella caseinilytica]|uniref:CRP/FNR family transcriptional regulator, anaerobic regulatory protein n=1 Tax=Evansella caseinilytica TaxID=1503961 RepID=A0A1H3PKZ4_9BACI|nr:Crp/Fnr family transcriptional regulator [Evansella caseinilytica]SDZ01731.1 CRP/FNR family transcriptional regulator, anaerobic regulatory protein [Evansella caseinilytica]